VSFESYIYALVDQVMLFDQNGKQVFSQDLRYKKTMDLSSLSSGIYFAYDKMESKKEYN